MFVTANLEDPRWVSEVLTERKQAKGSQEK